MAEATQARILIAATLLQSAAVLYGFPATMNLERAFPTNHRVELSQLRARDRLRHGRLLQSTGESFVDFPVAGSFNPYLVGLYFTRVKLGSPSQEFYVQIDTGSDVLWVNCNSCKGCPKSTSLKIELNSFDVGSSNTASMVSCSDQICKLGLQSGDSACSGQSDFDQCIYSFQYGDGSGTSGYYVQDLLYMDTVPADYDDPTNTNSSANIVFGCSTSATGDLTSKNAAVDGIFGFGQQQMSAISQLSSQGIAPNVFSHCFKGDNSGGGILVLGEIVEPNMVYTPLVPSQPHYNLNLQNISVNDKVLHIDPEEFTTSTNRGTIIDSGTTLAYLAQNIYDPFVNAITNAVNSEQVTLVTSQGNQCYIITSSITTDIFPQVIFNFAGNASMVLGPKDYLLEQNSIDGAELWCIGFQKNQGQDTTILGDLVLKDRIVVYDLGGSMTVNVSANSSSGTEFANMGPRTITNNSFKNKPLTIITLSILNIFFSYFHFVTVTIVTLLHTTATTTMHDLHYSSSMMTLKRAFPPNHLIELKQLRARDELRHGRKLQDTNNSAINFPVGGTFNPSQVGLYYAEIKLGSPPQKYHVQIDTGSDIELNSYDPKSSNTSSSILCSNQMCKDGVGVEESLCSFHSNRCIYTFTYGDGSTTTGFYVSDLLSFDTIDGSSHTNSSASVVFGCSKIASGELSRTESAVDGIFGLGQNKLSVISQLSSQGISPKIFSHCLKGDDNGGGTLLFGDVQHPNMVYTPIVPSKLHYNINLVNISVNGKELMGIDSKEYSLLSTTNDTVVDSGTTLAYLPKHLYKSFIMADGDKLWCMGFMENKDTTILGDLVLKDKLVVYDLANQRIGWTDYNCSLPVNVSTNSSELVKEEAPNSNNTFKKEPSKIIILITILIITFLYI
ncbi:hypothetical protein G4B88_011100 [Cannabis sativa]|uniref:Peptidase A1 domain-containing protein n=1 Tax=Cannabis sativa TaxID=3483 RepID=A0A7J6DNL6_CANSA|nr:hypothetical protein G4B88_011100 [Cannabis sativa]